MLLQGGGELNGNLQIKGNFKSKNIYYFGSNNQFKQLFWNLIKNAAKAMHKGGELTIDFNQEKKDEIQLKIADTGIGMTKEEEEKIFDPFYSGFTNGRGLGLSVVRRIVDTYKGNIKVDSEPDKGTEITITLPVGEREKLRIK
jgi:two-component system sensor histidine kinase PilS (NtrC family)